jgi:hypothetical protein
VSDDLYVAAPWRPHREVAMHPIYEVVNYALGACVLFLVTWRVLQFIVEFTAREIRALGRPSK